VGGGVVDAVAGEPRQVLERQLAVLRSAGNDDRAGLHRAAVRQLDLVGPALAAQAHGGAGDVHVGAEFLRLHERASGQRLA
jgi:hypothetical protein